MPPVRKQHRHMKKARGERKACRKSELLVPDNAKDLEGESVLGDTAVFWREVPASVYWEGLSDGEEEEEDECKFTEGEEDAEPEGDALAYLMATAENRGDALYDDIKVRYQRCAELSKKQKRRKQKEQRELKLAALGSRTLDDGFLIRPTALNLDPAIISEAEHYSVSTSGEGSAGQNEVSRQEISEAQRTNAMILLEKKLRSKKTADVLPQNIIRHQAVLCLFKVQNGRKLGETRQEMAQVVARCFGKGLYFAQKLVTWELQWILEGKIEEGRRGCYAKTRSWFNDEGVQIAVREWLAGMGESMSSTFLYNK